jgi:hypothetical protein
MRWALSVGRFDFWNLTNGKRTDELTPYEELCWQVYENIEPWGERRADMRTVTQTLQLIQSNRTSLIPPDARTAIIKQGISYWNPKDVDESVTPDEAAKQGKAAFAAVGIK